jgi:hypothetical protein
VEETIGNTPSGAPAPTPEPSPAPAPTGSTPATGGAGGGSSTNAPWGTTLARGVYGAAAYTQLVESLEDLELMTYQDDDGDGQCSVNPMCQSPNGSQSCDEESGSCSGGCTGRDADVSAFNECVTDASTPSSPSTPTSGLSVPDTLVNPTPDSNGFTSMIDAGLLACMAGGTPVGSACAGTSVRLCTEESPSCGCGVDVSVAPPPAGVSCSQINCVSNASLGEAAEGVPSGVGACGCQSVMGGK